MVLDAFIVFIAGSQSGRDGTAKLSSFSGKKEKFLTLKS